MSSKAKHPGPTQHGPQATKNLEGLHDDDVIVVPKGTSKLRFLFLLGLTIFILVIFTVGDELIGSIGRQARNTDLVSWDNPLIGKRTWTAAEFMDEKVREDDYRSLMRRFMNLGDNFEDEDFAAQLLVDELAKKSGIEIPTAELSKVVYEGMKDVCPPFQNHQIYTMYLKEAGISPLRFEGVLRRKLRAIHFQELIGAGAPVADSNAIEVEWKKRHPQVAFDLIEVEHAKFDAEAKALQPDEAGMKAWFDALDNKHSLFLADYLPESMAAELVAYRFGGENTAAGLLERFPRPADKDLEQLAKDYYNQYSSVRFVRETPLPEDLPVPQGKDRLINSYEEVAELARKESLVLAAFRDWVADIKARKRTGEIINLDAEATTFGLSYRGVDAAKTEAEWSALPEFGGPFMARSVMGTPKDDFSADVALDRTAMTFARALEKVEATPPAYEKVAEKAVAEWLKQKVQALASAKLNLVRDSFPKPQDTSGLEHPKADEAAFKAAAEAQGLSVERRDWMSFNEQSQDPDSQKPSHEFLRVNGFLRNLKLDEVSAVQTNGTRTHSYLVRSLGEREPPVAKVGPGDLAQIQNDINKKNVEAFLAANFSPKALSDRYKLRVRGSKTIPEPST